MKETILFLVALIQSANDDLPLLAVHNPAEWEIVWRARRAASSRLSNECGLASWQIDALVNGACYSAVMSAIRAEVLGVSVRVRGL